MRTESRIATPTPSLTTSPTPKPSPAESEADVFDRRIGDVLDLVYLERYQDLAPPGDTAAWLAALTDRWGELETTRTSAAADLYLAAVALAATATGLATHLSAQEEQEERDH